jgi:hypothetical protein
MTLRHSKRLVWFAAFLLCLAAGSAQAEEPPKFPVVADAVLAYFASLPGYQPGDLITQSQVEGALEAVGAVGWNVPQSAEIVGLALGDASFLASELAKPKGKQFMRKIARFPGGYQRLDGLSRIANGKDAVRILIRDPGGDKMIEYMATTQGGHELGNMMAGAKRGVNLNKPSSRIYTADELVAVLEMVYAQYVR